MKLTDVKIRKIFDGEERVKALVSITIESCLVVHDIKVINFGERIGVSMPGRKINGVICDSVHPIKKEFRMYLEEKILEKYNQCLSEKNLLINHYIK